MASPSDNSSDSNAIPLTENDIPGASLLGRKPKALKNSELKFWLKCRGDTRKGLKTKAELVKRGYEYIRSGKDKQIIDPDPHKIYSRRKQKQGTSSELVKERTKAAEFPTTGWGTSLEKMPMFTRLQMNHHVLKSGKTIGNQAVCVTRFNQSECVICGVIFALGKSLFRGICGEIFALF